MKLRQNFSTVSHVHQPQRLDDKLSFEANCIHVYDGDTLQVERVSFCAGGSPIEIIRLAGIDAPEMRSADRAAAIASRQALCDRVFMRRVIIQPTKLWRDPYNRIVARVYLGSEDLNCWLVQAGWARLLRKR